MNLSDKAMLASISISQWSAKKHDKKVSSEVAQAHNSDVNMGRYNKSLIAKKALDKIGKIAGAARTGFYGLTLPWKDNGDRILTNAGYYKLTEKVRQWRSEFDNAKSEFVHDYPSLVKDARISLNGLFNESDYPTQSEIETKFRFAFHVFPLPSAEDFRVKLSDTESALVRQQITASVQASVDEAMKDVWTRMQGVVSHMAGKLKAYKVTADKTEGIFRDSLVTNIRELLDIIPALNLTDDPKVFQFAAEMRELAKYDANTLRDNDGTREQITQAADDILKKMSAFV